MSVGERLRLLATPRAVHTRLALTARLRDEPHLPLAQVLTDDVTIDLVVLEAGAGAVPVRPSTLASLGLDEYAASDLAIRLGLVGATFETRGPGWATLGPRGGAAPLLLAWRQPELHDQLRERTGLQLEAPAFVAIRDNVLYAVDPDDDEAVAAVAASVARVVEEEGVRQPWLSLDILRPHPDHIEALPLPVPDATRRIVALARHRYAYGAAGEQRLLQDVYGGHQGDLQLGDEGLRAVPTGYPALLGEADVVVDASGAEQPFDRVRELGKRVEGLHPPVWLLEAPVPA